MVVCLSIYSSIYLYPCEAVAALAQEDNEECLLHNIGLLLSFIDFTQKRQGEGVVDEDAESVNVAPKVANEDDNESLDEFVSIEVKSEKKKTMKNVCYTI